MSKDANLLNDGVDFPCGRRSSNRFVKAALYEALADWGGGGPNDELYGLYHLWAQGNWGMVLTGNVQVSKEHLTLGRDMCVPEQLLEESVTPFKYLADIIHGGSPTASDLSSSTEHRQPTLAIMQLSHAGRQSPRLIGGRSLLTPPLGASTVPMKSRSDSWIGHALFGLTFAPPKEATDDDIEDVIEKFVRGAELSVEAGFDGVQLHCSHGYLLAQFMSPKTNTRPLPYGPPSSLHLLRTLISRIRAVVPSTHMLGLKLNASDYVQGGLTEDDALEQVRVIAGLQTDHGQTCVDFIEVSGGDYETPEFLVMADSPSRRQAFFATFARRALEVLKDIPNPPRIMLTGGLTSTTLMAETVRAHHADLVGIGRAAIADPLLPRRFLSHQHLPSASDSDIQSNVNEDNLSDQERTLVPNPPPAWWTPPVILANASVGTAQWTALLHRRAALGDAIASMSAESDDALLVERDDWLMPLVDASQHEAPLRSVVELLVKADMLDRIIWLIKYFAVLGLSFSIFIILRRMHTLV